MTLFESLFLIAGAILLLLFADSTPVFQLVVFVGSGVTFHMFFRMMKDPKLVRFGNVACFSILFGYVVSTAFYTIANFTYYAGLDYRVNVFGLGYSQTIISYALLIVFISSVLLSAISRFEKPLYLSAYLQESLSTRSLWLIILSAVMIMIGLVNGDIGYMGIYLISERRISPFGALCFVAIPPLTVITIGYILSLPSALKKYRKILIIVFLFLVVAIVPLGRRVLMYTTILGVILIGPILFESFRKKRIKMFHILGVVLAMLVIVSWGFRTFYAMRIAVSKMALQQKPGVMEIVPNTIELMRDSYAMAELQEELTENVSHRPFVLSYLAGLIEAHTEKDTPFFCELRYAFAMAVPSLLHPQKTRKMAPAAEDVIHPLLGLSVFDGPNTMLTAGLNDLGFIGMLLYPIAVVGLYVLLCRLVAVKLTPFLYLFIVLCLMYFLLYLEEGLGALVGSGLRDLAVVALVYWVILKIPAHKFAIGRFRRSNV